MSSDLTYWANHNDLIGDHHGFSNTNLLELLGKQVSFSWLGADGVTYNFEGQLTTIVFDLESSPQFTVDKSDYFIFDEITDFKIL